MKQELHTAPQGRAVCVELLLASRAYGGDELWPEDRHGQGDEQELPTAFTAQCLPSATGRGCQRTLSSCSSYLQHPPGPKSIFQSGERVLERR